MKISVKSYLMIAISIFVLSSIAVVFRQISHIQVYKTASFIILTLSGLFSGRLICGELIFQQVPVKSLLICRMLIYEKLNMMKRQIFLEPTIQLERISQNHSGPRNIICN